MSRKTPSLTTTLIARKGEAAPTVERSPTEGQAQGRPLRTAITVKLDADRYRRLKLLGIDLGKTSQEVMVEALDDYLAHRKS